MIEHSFDTGEVVLNYAEGPDNGPPLVLLHGGTDRWSTFEFVIHALTEDWHVYALDFRGHGKSGRATTGYAIPDYARDVIEFVRKMVGEPVVLIGHSMGADTSTYIAANAPDTVRAAVLEEPLYSDENLSVQKLSVYPALLSFQSAVAVSRTAEGIGAELTRERPNWPESLVRTKAECLSLLDPEALDSIVGGHHTDGYVTEELLPQIKAPVLLIQGNHSRGGLLSDDDALRMAAQLESCTFVQMLDGGHEPHSRRLEKFLEFTKEFLDSL